MLTVLFLPGLDGAGRSAEKIAAHLPPGISLDVFTYPTGRPVSLEELVHLLGPRLAQAGGRLMGESFGGVIAIEAALARPADVRSLFLLSTFNHTVEPLAVGIGRAATRWLPAFLLKPVGMSLIKWKLASQLTGENREKYLAHVSSLDLRDLGHRLEILARFDARPRLREIRIPVEVLIGSGDPNAATSEQLEPWRHMLNCHVEAVAGASHFLSIEQPELVAGRVAAWARREGA
jgi:pimeloyl-ACP methyl ester carboxylesterase